MKHSLFFFSLLYLPSFLLGLTPSRDLQANALRSVACQGSYISLGPTLNRFTLVGLPKSVVSRMSGLPLIRQHSKLYTRHMNLKPKLHITPSPYIPWDNLPLRKDPIAEPKIEPGTSWLVANDPDHYR